MVVVAVAAALQLSVFGARWRCRSMPCTGGGRTSTPGGAGVALLWEQPDARAAGRLAVRHGFARCWRAYAWLASLDFSGRRAFEWLPASMPPEGKAPKNARRRHNRSHSGALDSSPDLCLGGPHSLLPGKTF